jgi:uncharacterized protein YbaA (DUF1428 family)
VAYIDGFVIPMPKKGIPAYKKIATLASKVWMEHGALRYVEAIGEDLKTHCGLPFPKLAKAKPGETVVFAFIVYKSRAHRDAVNKKVMADKRISEACGPESVPFDVKRMSFGGFQSIVNV